MLLKARYNGREDVEKEVSSYWLTLRNPRRYCKLKGEALDGTVWRNGFGRGYGPVVGQTTWLQNSTLTSSVPTSEQTQCVCIIKTNKLNIKR